MLSVRSRRRISRHKAMLGMFSVGGNFAPDLRIVEEEIRARASEEEKKGGRLLRWVGVPGVPPKPIGDLKGAQESYKNALRDYGIINDKRKVDEMLNDLARIHNHLKNFEDALRMYQQSLAIRKEKFGPTNPLVVDGIYHLAVTFYNLANLRLARKKYGDAISELNEALKLLQTSELKTRPDAAELTVRVLEQLAELYYNRALTFYNLAIEHIRGGEYDDAMSELNEALQILQTSELNEALQNLQKNPTAAELTVRVLKSLADLYDKMARKTNPEESKRLMIVSDKIKNQALLLHMDLLLEATLQSKVGKEETRADGTKVTTYADSATYEIKGQSKILTLPNGTAYEIRDDGTKIITDDGATHEYKTDGTNTVNMADGGVHKTMPDGTIHETLADRTTRETRPDGTIHETLTDGTTRETRPDGTIHETLADGTIHETMPDGTIHETLTDGTKTVNMRHETMPDGTIHLRRRTTTRAAAAKTIADGAGGTTHEIGADDGSSAMGLEAGDAERAAAEAESLAFAHQEAGDAERAAAKAESKVGRLKA